jgi:TRAP-type C4-dicarboxylate transport system permease small subunit
MYKLLDRIEKALDAVLVFMMIVMAGAVVLQVTSRYVFNNPTSWSEELARYLFVWITFLGAAVVIRKRRHVDVTVLTDRLPPSAAKVVYLVSDAAVLFMLGALTWAGAGLAIMAHRQLSAAMDLPMSLAYSAMPVGTGLMFVFLVATMIWEWKEGRRIGGGDQL